MDEPKIIDKAKDIADKNLSEAVIIQKVITKNFPVKTLWQKVEPADLFAFILVIGIVMANLIQIKQQFMIPQALLLITGYYFGRRIDRPH